MSGSFRVGEWLVEPQINTLTNADRAVRVEPKNMLVLVCLTEHAGEVVPKERLIRQVWGDTFVTDDVLTHSVSELRKAFGDDSKNPRYIQTVPRSGYRLIAPVNSEPARKGADSDRVADGGQAPAVIAPRRWRVKYLTWAVALLSVGGSLWFFFGRPAHPAPSITVAPFTSFSGNELCPVFSPDGNQIAFTWGGEKDDNADIYVKTINGERPVRLTTDPSSDYRPTWSPDGQRIAFIRSSESQHEVFTVPVLGNGPERKLLSLSPRAFWVDWEADLEWSADGTYIVYTDKTSTQAPININLFSPDTGERRALTSPPADYWGDVLLAVSPDSQTVAFVRMNTLSTSDLYVMPVTGVEPKRLTSDNALFSGLDWTADGREIIFASDRDGNPGLWKIPASGGTPEHLTVGGDNASNPTVSRKGQRLAFVQAPSSDTNIYRIDVPSSTGQPTAPIKLIASTRHDFPPQISPDGKRIAFSSTRTGNSEIWLCNSEGQDLIQLTFLGGPYGAGTPRWSPDGKQVAFDSHTQGKGDVYVIDVEGGFPRRLTMEPSEDILPSWSRDGRWIYFASDRSGEMQVWKVPAVGGEALQVTRQGGILPFESTDGKVVYYSKGFTVAGIWRVAVDGGEESPVVESLKAGFWGDWAVVDDGIYFINPGEGDGAAIEFFSFSICQSKQIADLGKVDLWAHGFAVSPDRRWILYTQWDTGDLNGGDIMLAENFR